MRPAQLLVWRIANELSQKAAATYLSVAARTYQYYESGERAIPDKVAAMVVAVPDTSQPDVKLVPPPAPGETSETHPQHYRRVATKKGHKIERLAIGQPVSDGNWASGRVARPPGRSKEDDEIAAILRKSRERRSEPEPLPLEWSNLPEAPDDLFEDGDE